jgi:hypothetical protein
MFNPLNNPIVIRTVLDKAQEELNESLKFRKRQFNNDKLYMWVEIDSVKQLAYIILRNELDENLVKMTAEELMADKDIKEQLKKIPSIVRPFLNFKKIIPEMNKTLCRKLGESKFLKITEGSKSANIFICDLDGANSKATSLFDIFA